MKNAVKEIKKDCFNAMAPAWIVNTFETVLSGMLSIWLATLVADFTDAVLLLNKETLVSEIWKIIFGVIISAFIFPLISYLCNTLMLKRALKHDRKVMAKFLRKKYNSAMKMGVGEAQSRLENDPNDYRIKWMEMMTQFVSLPIVLAGLIYSSLRLHWKYAVITMLISTVRVFLPFAIRKLNAKYDKELRDYTTALRKCEMNILSQPHYITIFGIKNGMLNKIDAEFQNYYQHTGKKSAIGGSVTSFFISLIDTVSWILIILIGAIFVSQNFVTAGTIAAMLGFSSIYNNIINSATYIIKESPIIKTLTSRMLMLYADAELYEEKSITTFSELSAKSVSYKYNDILVFEPLNFCIRDGEHVAICGENGSGKSTLLHILCGLNCDYEGSVRINGTELSTASLDNWRNQIALATQKPFLFPGTVLENLTFGGLASKEEAISVLEKMGISYLANREISINQDDLSGGEKQKISLSRVILMKTQIIFLDEPSNNLDEDSVLKLKEFISSSNKTIIYISHSNSLTELASKIITVKKVENSTTL